MALDYIRHTDITLRTLSQVHIGNGDKLSSVGDYLITSKSLYFLDNDRLLRDIEQAGRTADFVKALRAFQTGFDFAGTLEEWGINHGDYHTREIPLHQSGEITTSNNLLYRCVGIPVTDNRYQLPYIPGSTLKGLLRTAIIFQYYRDHPGELSSLEAKVKREVENAQNVKKALNHLWQGIESDILPLKLFQSIRLTDSQPFKEIEVVVEQTHRQHFYGIETEGLDWLTECIKKGAETRFDLSIVSGGQNNAFNYLESPSPKHIFSILNQHSKLLIEQEIDLLKAGSHAVEVRDKLLAQLAGYKDQIDEGGQSYAITRIGKGKTLFFITVLPLLSKQLQKKVLQRLRREGSDTIQSRVVTTVDPQLFGWIRLEKEPPPISFPNNQVEEIIPEVTTLEVVVTGHKKVSFQLNDELLESIQLIDQMKRKPREGDQITVIVWRLKNDGTINQVKYL